MNILIDLILLAILFISIFYAIRKANVNALVSVVLAVVSVAASWALARPVSGLAVSLVQPGFERLAAGEIASMVGVPALDNGYDTMTAVTPEQIFGLGQDLDKLAGRYGVSVQTLQEASAGMTGAMASQTVLSALVRPVSIAVTCAVVRLLLFFVVYWLLKILFKALAGRRMAVKPRAKNRLVTGVLGVVMGVLLAGYVFLPALATVAPYHAGFLNLLDIQAACDRSLLYRVFALTDPFLHWMV